MHGLWVERMRNKNPLLTIELDTINSVPRVFHKGEEITNQVHIKFEWNTQKESPVFFDTPVIEINQIITDHGEPYNKSIGYNSSFKDGDPK